MSQQAIHRRKVRRHGYRAGRRAYTGIASKDNKRFGAVGDLDGCRCRRGHGRVRCPLGRWVCSPGTFRGPCFTMSCASIGAGKSGGGTPFSDACANR